MRRFATKAAAATGSKVSPGAHSLACYNEIISTLNKKGIDIDSRKALAELCNVDAEVAQQVAELDRAVAQEKIAEGTKPWVPPKSTPATKVALTGAAGNIGYAALFRIASGEMLGPHVPIDLRLLDIPGQEKALEGVKMELDDCAFPLLRSVTIGSKAEEAFDNVDVALLVGAKPRGKGMTRGDLLKDNGAIFKAQGAALNAAANKETLKAVVVGNPANTNAWVASQFAPDISPTQFSALTRLDHNRGLAQLSNKLGVAVDDITRFAIWGNHSATQVPDVSHTQIEGKWALDMLKGQETWLNKTFVPEVQNRGAAIIAARGASSAASAASATIEHINKWVNGTQGQWTSMGVWSDGSYGAEEGVYYSYPVVCENGAYTVVQNAAISKATAAAMEISNKELITERDEIAAALGIKIPSIKQHYVAWKKKFDAGGLPGAYPPGL